MRKYPFGARNGSVPVKVLVLQFCAAGWADQDAGRGSRGELIRVRVLAVRTASERVLMS